LLNPVQSENIEYPKEPKELQINHAATDMFTRIYVVALFCMTALVVSCERGTPSADAGRLLYGSNGCAMCHGAQGHGDGKMGGTLDPRPRDFRDAAAFKNGTDIEAIAQTIASGVSVGGRMPGFSHLTKVERRSLALFVISLRDQSSTGASFHDLQK
jgi:hypothetical protein